MGKTPLLNLFQLKIYKKKCVGLSFRYGGRIMGSISPVHRTLFLITTFYNSYVVMQNITVQNISK